MSPIFIGPQSSVQPRASTPGLAYRAPLLSGEAGTKQTVDLMRKLVDQAVADQEFVRFAIELVRNVTAYDDVGELQALYDWVKRNIRYTKDPVTKEKLYPPAQLLKIRAGDCDDISMLLGALAIALGHPARLITISANASNPEEFVHVYLEAEAPPGSGLWIPMDAARLDSQFGVEPPIYYRKRAWSLTDESYQDLNGTCAARCGQAHMRGMLSGYAALAGMGDMGQDGFDWGSLVQTTIQETPALIAAASGQPVNVRGPGGSVQTGPYASFATPYTPGYGIPPAGYQQPSASLSADMPILLLLGLGALLLLGGGRR